MKKEIYPRQQQLKEYIQEYGIAAAVEGTGLTLCEVRSAYTDPRPVYDHLVRVFQFYRGLVYQDTLRESGGYF